MLRIRFPTPTSIPTAFFAAEAHDATTTILYPVAVNEEAAWPSLAAKGVGATGQPSRLFFFLRETERERK